MDCKVCNKTSEYMFSGNILNKYNVKYFQCTNCGFTQTEEPYWLDEAYSESINVSDTGYMQRNIVFSKKLTVILKLFFNKSAKYLDFAGGYGVFVRLMRDVGFDFYWEDKYTKNYFAKGFEYNGQDIELVTSFESFEHFVNPIDEIEKLLSITNNIIFSTELMPENNPKPSVWWYYGIEHGQHISFYSEKTLHFIANKYGLKYTNLGGLHLFSKKKISAYSRVLLKFTNYGLYRLFLRGMESHIWSDHCKLTGIK